jgi:dolichol-phosphate mannosyltransferase
MSTDATRGPAWLVLPTYNEADNVEPLVESARSNLPAATQILVVDDGSPDGTGERADRLAARHANVGVLHRGRKEGIGPAYVAGFRRALAGGAGLVLQMDADFSHDPAYLPRLIEASRSADLVLGSRYVAGGATSDWGPMRRAISRGGSAYARRVLGVDVRDLTGGFKCFRREVLEAIDLGSVAARGYAFQIETTYRALRLGFRVAEVPIVFRDRRLGNSKMDGSILAEAVWKVPRLRFGRDHVKDAPADLPDSPGEGEQGAILSEVLSDEPRIRESEIQ